MNRYLLGTIMGGNNRFAKVPPSSLSKKFWFSGAWGFRVLGTCGSGGGLAQ